MGSRPMRRGAFVGVLAAVVVAAGCGGQDRPTGPATPLPSYLALYPSGPAGAVYFLQWERREDAVDGTLTILARAARDAPRTQPVTGEIDGRRITLDVGADDAQQWDGERLGRRIVFRVELDDGSFTTLRFVPATLADYRRAVG
jgi:hypothetical protein